MRAPWKQRYVTLPTVDVLELEGAAVGGSGSGHIVRSNLNRRHTVGITVEHNDRLGDPKAILDVTAEGPRWLRFGWWCERYDAGSPSNHNRSCDRQGPFR